MKGLSYQMIRVMVLRPSQMSKSVATSKPNNILLGNYLQQREASSLNLPPCSKSKTCSGKCKLRLKQQAAQQNKKKLQTAATTPQIPNSALISSKRERHALRDAEDDDVARLEFNTNDAESLLEVKVGNHAMKIPYIWLRDSCRSDSYFDHKRYQKNPDWDLLDRDLTPASVRYTSKDGDALSVYWKDGHVSKFDPDWLVENFFPGRFSNRVKRFCWNKAAMNAEPLPVVTFNDHMNTEEGLTQSLSNLVRYGFTVVSEAPPDAKGTQLASERISEVQDSVFGGMWTVSPKMSNNDTAYTNDYLGAHTDTTYLASPAGIEVFHCLEHNGTGGETLLVDGFQVVENLRQTDPEAFNMLTHTVVPFEYKEEPMDGKPSYHMVSYNKLVEVHPASGELLSFRYNPYHRGVINTVEPERLQAFLAAYDKLAKDIQNQDNEFWLKLHPGNVLFVDNWRVMHGRSGFTGFRLLSGCYLSRDEWLSQARLYGVL